MVPCRKTAFSVLLLLSVIFHPIFFLLRIHFRDRLRKLMFIFLQDIADFALASFEEYFLRGVLG